MSEAWHDGNAVGAWVMHNHHVYSRHFHAGLGGGPAAMTQGWGSRWRWWAWSSCSQQYEQGTADSTTAARDAADAALKRLEPYFELSSAEPVDFRAAR